MDKGELGLGSISGRPFERGWREGVTHTSHDEPLLWLVWRTSVPSPKQADLVFRLGLAVLLLCSQLCRGRDYESGNENFACHVGPTLCSYPTPTSPVHLCPMPTSMPHSHLLQDCLPHAPVSVSLASYPYMITPCLCDHPLPIAIANACLVPTVPNAQVLCPVSPPKVPLPTPPIGLKGICPWPLCPHSFSFLVPLCGVLFLSYDHGPRS